MKNTELPCQLLLLGSIHYYRLLYNYIDIIFYNDVKKRVLVITSDPFSVDCLILGVFLRDFRGVFLV